jgi:hypothetical protein
MKVLKQTRKNGRTETTNRERTQLVDERLMQALHLFKEADNVELKLTVPDSDRSSAVTALDMDVLDAELRQVVFFDTPDLKLSEGGVVVRARRVRKDGNSVIKLRPVVPASLPNKLRRSGNFTIEVDVMPGGFVCSGSLKGRVANSEVKKVVLGKQSIRRLFSPEQQSFYKEHAPKSVALDSLKVFGPINVAKLKFSPDGSARRMIVAEMWFYPDGSRTLELSTKCPPTEAFQVLAEMRALLTRHGISVTGDQPTKTHKALEYFSRLHREAARKRAS